jgi:hypothetical protein
MNSYGHPTSTASVEKFNNEANENKDEEIISDSKSEQKELKRF